MADFKLKDLTEPTPFKLVFDSPRKAKGVRGEERAGFKLVRMTDGVEGDLWTSNLKLTEQLQAFGRGDCVMISRVGDGRQATYMAEELPAAEAKDVLPEAGETPEYRGKLSPKHYAEVYRRCMNQAYKAMLLVNSDENRQAVADELHNGDLDALLMPEPMDLMNIDNLRAVAASFWITLDRR